MTLSTTTARVEYLGTGSVDTYAYPFKVLRSADLVLTTRDTEGTEETLAEGTDYSVTGAGSAAGGTVVLSTALATGVTLVVRRVVDPVQSTDIQNQTSGLPRSVEAALDYRAMSEQSIADGVRRSLKVAATAPAAVDPELPYPMTAGQLLAVNGTADGFTLTSVSSSEDVVLPGDGRTADTLTALLANASVFNVKDYGAVGDGVTDDTLAIEAADIAASSTTLIFDGVTRKALGVVYFPPGVYKHTGLNYRGAPWQGAGPHVTRLLHYTTSGASLNCVGTALDRRIVSIRDMTFDGTNAAAGAYGLRLGHNYRSFGALRNVRITQYPSWGIYFAADSWNMSFYDVYVSYCGRTADSGIGIDAACTFLGGIEFYSLNVENNGTVGSGLGGLEFNSSAPHGVSFYGGVWEGNYGAAEARFIDGSAINLFGTYIESDPGSVTDGLVFGGSAVATAVGVINTAGAGHTGKAFVVKGTAMVALTHPRGHDVNWAKHLSVEDTAECTLVSDGKFMDTAGRLSVAAGATLRRVAQKRLALADAATIAVDAAFATQYTVVLAGNRTMGAPTNPSPYQRITFFVVQDGTGGRTLAWNAAFKHSWSDAGNTAGKWSTISFVWNGTNWIQDGAQSPYV